MLRPFLSLLVASVATVLGLGIGLTAAVRRAASIASGQVDIAADGLVFVGVLLLAVAAASLTIHWLGTFIVGAIHLVLGGLAVLVPTRGIRSGVLSPIYEVTRMLSGVDRYLGEGAAVFYFSGTGLVLGAFLVAAALAKRSRLDAPPTRRANAVIASIVGAVALVGALVLLVVVGNQFVMQLFMRFESDQVLALGIAGAALLAGIGGLALRWSSGGGIVVGATLFAVGVVTFLGSSSLPDGTRAVLIVTHGLPMVIGVSILVIAIVAALRHRRDISEPTEAL